MRRLALVLVLLWAPAAHAQPVALGPSSAVDLSAGAAIVAATTATGVSVTRVPLDGSAPATLYQADVPADRRAFLELAASDQRIGLIVTLARRRGGALQSAQVFTGPPDGPLTAAAPPVRFTRDESGSATPNQVQVAGEDVIVEDERGQVSAFAPDGAQSPVTIPENSSAVTFAGDLVAYGARRRLESEEDPPTRLVLANWRTGAVIRSLTLDRGLIRLDLREDGRALLELDGGPVQELSADGMLTPLSFDASTPLQAGERTVVRRHDDQAEFDRLVVIEPGDAARHDVGLRGRAIVDAAADADHVVWRSHGCAFAAGLEEGPSQTFTGAAGCAGSEPYILSQTAAGPRLARRLTTTLGCLNAVDGVCRGTLRGREIVPVSYTVAVGARKRIRFVVRPAAYRRLKRSRYRSIHFTSPPGFPMMLRDGPRRRHG